MKTKLQKAKYWASVSAIGIVLGVGLQFVKAWVEPVSAPPASNIAAPLNTSNIGQSKAGGLILNTGGAANGLIVQNGNVGIGTTTPASKLDVSGDANVSGALVVGSTLVAKNEINMMSSRIFNVNGIDMNGGGIKFSDGSVQTTAARYTTCFWTSSTQLRANPASGDYTLDCGANMVMKGIRFLGTGGGDHNFITNVSINCCSR